MSLSVRSLLVGFPGLCEFCEGAANHGRLPRLRQPCEHRRRAAAVARAQGRECVILGNAGRCSLN